MLKSPLITCCISCVAGVLFTFYFPFTEQFFSISVVVLIALSLFFVRFKVARKGLFVGLSACLFATLGAWRMQQMDVRTGKSVLHTKFGEGVTLSGEIRETSSTKTGTCMALLKVAQVWTEDQKVPCDDRLIAFLQPGKVSLRAGDLLVIHGQLNQILSPDNPGGFDAEYFYASRRITGAISADVNSYKVVGHEWNINAQLLEWRTNLSDLMSRYLSGKSLGVAQALILGDKTNLDPEVVASFSSTGAMHVLAVSGLHIGLLLILFNYGLSLFGNRISKRQRTLITFGIIWMYGGITGASAAVLRAVFMFSFVAIGQLLYRKSTTINGLVFSAILLIIIDPWVIFDLGFQLSYAAMLGILLLYPSISGIMTFSYKWIQLAWEGTAVGIAATCFTFPITTFWFYQFPNYFALANLGVMVLGFLVLLFGLLFLLTIGIPYLILLISLLFTWTITWLIVWIAWVDELPGAVSGGFHLPVWMVLVLFACLGLWVVHLNYKVVNRWVVVLLTFLIFIQISCQRIAYFKTSEVIIFAGNQFILAVKEGKMTHAFYTKKYRGEWEIPKELKAFKNYSGTHMVAHRITGNRVGFRNEKCNLMFRLKGPVIKVSINERDYSYRLYGVAEKNLKQEWMSLRLQQKYFPDQHPRCVRIYLES